MLWQVKMRYAHKNQLATIIQVYAYSRQDARSKALQSYTERYGVCFDIMACEASRKVA